MSARWGILGTGFVAELFVNEHVRRGREVVGDLHGRFVEEDAVVSTTTAGGAR